MNQAYSYINLEAIGKELDRYFSNFNKGKIDRFEEENLFGRYQSEVQTVFESWRLSHTPAWFTDISTIKNYNIEISDKISFDPKKYEIRTNSISFLLEREGILESKWNNYYPTDRIKFNTAHMPLKMLRLMVYILAGKKLLPPLYIYHSTRPGLITRVDGTHRITLCRYLGVETIPYLIESTTADFHRIYFPKQ